jgi:hypothetical protein
VVQLRQKNAEYLPGDLNLDVQQAEVDGLRDAIGKLIDNDLTQSTKKFDQSVPYDNHPSSYNPAVESCSDPAGPTLRILCVELIKGSRRYAEKAAGCPPPTPYATCGCRCTSGVRDERSAALIVHNLQ